MFVLACVVHAQLSSVRVKRHSTTNGHAAGTSVNDTGPPIKNAGPLISPQGVPSGSRGHLPVRAGSRSAFGRDEGAVAWASKGRIRAGEVNRDTVSKVRRRTPPQQPHTSGLGMDMAMRDGTGRQRGDERSGMRPDDSGGGDGLGDVAESVYVAHGGRQLSRRMYETKTLALPAADGWDPAVRYTCSCCQPMRCALLVARISGAVRCHRSARSCLWRGGPLSKSGGKCCPTFRDRTAIERRTIL